MPYSKYEKILLLLTSVFCFSLAIFASDSFVPSLPAIAASLHASISVTKLTVTLYFLSLGITPLIYGPVINYIGSKKTLFIGFSLLFIGSIVCLASGSISTLIIGRIIQGSGAGACITVPRSLLPKYYQGKRLTQVASALALIAAFVPAVAPVAGGYLQHAFGWHANFVMILGLVIIAAMLAYFNIKHDTPNQANNKITIKSIIKDYETEICNWRFLLCPIISGLAFLTVITYITLTPFLFQTVLGYTPVQYGHIALMISSGMIVGAILSRQLAHRVSSSKALYVGGGLMFFGSACALIAALIFKTSAISIALPIFIILLGVQIITANTYSLAMHLTTNIAIASALIGFVQLAGSGLLANGLSFITETNAIPMGACLTVITLLNLFCIRLLAKQQ